MGINNLWEYLLVSYPAADAMALLQQERQQMADAHKYIVAEKSKPTILIGHFLATESLETTIIKWTERICSNLSSLSVTLEGFTSIEPYSIGLRIKNPAAFRQLATHFKPVSDLIQASGYPMPHFLQHPQLSLAKWNNQADYEQAFGIYAQKYFSASFMLDELFLLKRQDASEACKTTQVFRLRPVNSQQFSDVA
ncbi:MAG: 2'-5' RNA ligase family protein [Chitinophagaceae bacterium]